MVPANVAYPTDSGLLAKAVRRIAATSGRIQAAGGAVRTRVRDRSRAAGKRAHAVASKLRSRAALGRDEATAAVLKSTGELAAVAQTAARDAERLLVNAQRAVRRATAKAAELRARGERDAAARRRRGRLVRAVNDLQKLVAATRQIAAQNRQRVSGQIPDGATRRVSLHDGDARRSPKAASVNRSEFGHQAQITDNDDDDDDGIVLDHTVEVGNPADAPQLAPAVARVTKRTGGAPGTVTADRGYGEKRVDDALHDLGVRTVVIPRKRQTFPGPASRGTPASLPANNQVAHRK
ncbi:MAG: Transposase [Mycobacterium sp.]|nr:Transposase [Mycobacterium sp.]